jgi:hypothetical protein
MKKWLGKTPTTLWAVACGCALYVHAEPSEVQDVFMWSWMRSVALVILAMLMMYCLCALRSMRLLNVNNYLSYLVVVVVLTLEVTFQLRPDLIPGEELIFHATKEVRKEYAKARGYMTEEMLSAEPSNGLIYHFHPNTRLPAYPHVTIDPAGYRNPPGLDPQTLDCVLLGDSLTLALDAKEDLGSLLRTQGYGSKNLGMFGYSPQHYRDVYKKFIIDAHIRHRYVLVFLFAGNDVQDAKNYRQVQLEGGDYKEYLPQMKSIGTVEQYLPIMVSVVRGIPRYVKSRLVTNRERTIQLPYRTISTGELMPPSRIQVGTDDWNYFIDPLGEIIAMARAEGATPVVFLFPSAATIYSPYDPTLIQYDSHYQRMSDAMLEYLTAKAVLFKDLQGRLRTEIAKEFIFAHEKDYHLNTIGVQKVSDEVLLTLKRVSRT